jgi:hypothetical protein
MSYSFVIAGNWEDGFTSAEIEDESGTFLCRVFELHRGWYVHLHEPELLRDGELAEAIVAAKEELLHYVNRKGADFSNGGWTRAAVSLWLMQRDDGKGFTVPTQEVDEADE